MKRRYTPYTLPPWMKKFRGVCQQFIVPFIVFQGLRTLIFPTFFDMLLLVAFVFLAMSLYFEWL
ncbi:hypothetical protein [Peribacillus simplex]|uniref:hypothetical protein n=1 Tax=Peribacillus simplex TaxID=1478 RepID=UPI003D2D9B7F